ncbi:MAG: hypothetical protein V2A34_00050 [Lentisphaerota bacterium]
MNLRRLLWVLAVLGLPLAAQAQRYFPDGIMLSNEYVRQQGLVDLQAWTGGAVTNENVRGLGISLGQLSGINPETGEAITDSTNLLPLVARSLQVSGASLVDGSLDMGGQPITNAVYYGDGHGLTNLSVSFTESDPVWAAASNAVAAAVNARLASNVWAAADATTNYVARTGGALSGALNMGGQPVTNAFYYGDGHGLTNLSVSFTESDPVWTAESNAVAAAVNARLASNVWAAADATTNYVARTGGTLSGALNLGGQPVTNAVYYGDGRGLTNFAQALLTVYNIDTNHVLADVDCDVFSINTYETTVDLPAFGPATAGRVYHVSNLGTGLLQVRVTNGADRLNGVTYGGLAIGQHGTLRIVGVSANDWVANQ